MVSEKEPVDAKLLGSRGNLNVAFIIKVSCKGL